MLWRFATAVEETMPMSKILGKRLQALGLRRQRIGGWSIDAIEVPALGATVPVHVLEGIFGPLTERKVRAVELLLSSKADLRSAIERGMFRLYRQMIRKPPNGANGSKPATDPWKMKRPQDIWKHAGLGAICVSMGGRSPPTGFVVDMWWNLDDGHPNELYFEHRNGRWSLRAVHSPWGTSVGPDVKKTKR